jgi:hypothetical protein
VVDAVRLACTSANLDIMREACLENTKLSVIHVFDTNEPTIIPYPHCRVKRTCDLIILFQSRAATENFWQPKLPNGTLHVSNSALNRSWSAHPL